MTKQSDKLLIGLEKIADIVAEKKPKLFFLGLIHRAKAPFDAWDLLISAGQLRSRSIESLRYVAKLMQRTLTANEMGRIAQIVILPRNNDLIAEIEENDWELPSRVRSKYPLDKPVDAIVIWPKKEARRAVAAA